jgi:CBS domain-containing protein
MRVRDIMTREVVSCRRETDLGTAARRMFREGVGTLPVVDEQGRLVGILTDRDIAMSAATQRRNGSDIAVHEAMSTNVRSCFGEEALGSALKQMEEARVRRLPVLDDSGRLAGILSMDDVIVRALNEPGGISPRAFVNTLRRICSKPVVEPAPVSQDAAAAETRP